MRHLLVTNDFPPQFGGIESMLWELWRRLDPSEVTVLTVPHAEAARWDAQQAFRVERWHQPVLLPVPALVRRIDALAAEVDASLVMLDPALPLGLLGCRLERPYAVVVHGAEVTVPGRLPGSAQLLGKVLRGARAVIAAGGYPAAEAERAAGQTLPITLIPPGVDVERFRPLTADDRAGARARLGLPAAGELVVGVSRLVPRKGFDVLIEAAALLAPSRPELRVAIAGKGRDAARLQRLVDRSGAPVTLLGPVSDDDLPALYGCGDVFAMPCRNRWLGLEQEGFGIVFVEAAAAGVPQVGGRSGGSDEAVLHGLTGLVVDDPRSASQVAAAIGTLLDDPARRAAMAAEGRRRTVDDLTYDVLAARLSAALDAVDVSAR